MDANRGWTKGRSGGAGFIIKKGIRCEDMTGKMGDVCLVKIRRSEHKFDWLVRSVYMNCEGVRKEENIKGVVWRIVWVLWRGYECPYMGTGWL